MTGEPSAWPPVSVVLAAGLLFVPLVGMAGVLAVAGRWGPLAGSLVWFAGAGAVAAELLRGNPAGRRHAAWVVGLVALMLLPAGVLGAANSPRPERGLLVVLPVAGWAATLTALLRWPETRRWCGLLPPADEGDEA